MAKPPQDQDLALRVRARHRSPGRVHRPAAFATAGIAAAALALATFAGVNAGTDEPAEAAPPPSLDVRHVDEGLTGASFAGADGSVEVLRGSVQDQQGDLEQARAERAERGVEALDDSLEDIGNSTDTVRAASEEIAEERAEAERVAAEEAEAERVAAEEAEAERVAAEQAEAERAEADQAAARSNEREPAPAESAPTGGSPKATAQGMLGSYGWGNDQWGCLESLWERESNWNHLAMNPSSGAYGIPQSLPGNKMASAGADWQTNPTTQITWGLGYIQDRYGSPCSAWAHSESVGWY